MLPTMPWFSIGWYRIGFGAPLPRHATTMPGVEMNCRRSLDEPGDSGDNTFLF
jgi:hypothetical protein